jgi:putative sigma-54 modulation protein
MVTIQITGRDEQVTSRNKDHAREKLAKLARYFDGITKLEAVLGHSGGEAEVEVVINVPRCQPLVCRSQAADLYAAIDLVLDKAEAQLTKHKERVKDRKAQRGVAGTDAEGGAGDETLDTYDEIVEERKFD